MIVLVAGVAKFLKTSSGAPAVSCGTAGVVLAPYLLYVLLALSCTARLLAGAAGLFVDPFREWCIKFYVQYRVLFFVMGC